MTPIDPRIDPALVPEGSKAYVIAEHQEEYINLPAVITPPMGPPGMEAHHVITRWDLTPAERLAVMKGADIYITIVGTPIRPFYATVGVVNWKDTK